MIFDFRLQVFHAVAKRLNFTKAAAELFITQPAVTKHIHELEHQLKIKLFERNGTRIKLTAGGAVLLQYTEEIFTLYRKLEFDINHLTQRQSGKLRLGASTTVAQYVLPPVLAAFHKKFTEVDITLGTRNTEQIEQALQNGEIDLGIIEGHSRNKAIKYTEFVKDELVLVANSQHPAARKRAIKASELKHIPFLLREPGSGTLEVIAHALKPLGIKLAQLQVEMELASTESIKAYLLHSDCMAFLSIHSIVRELRDKECAIIDVEGLTIERNFNFVQLYGQPEALPDLFMKFARYYNFR